MSSVQVKGSHQRAMKMQLSSGTWVFKTVLPAIGQLMLALAVVEVIRVEDERGGPLTIMAVMLALNAVLLYFAVKTRDAWVAGDDLVVKRGRRRERIDLCDIAGVWPWPIGKYRPVWITFTRRTPVGRSIVVITGRHLWTMEDNEIVEGLHKLIENRKRRAARQATGDASGGPL